MDIISARDERNNALVELFRQTFTDSEGAEEGDFIADLVAALFKQAGSQDLQIYTARAEAGIVGCILFSRLHFDQDARHTFLLSPVAVATKFQKQGIGQTLLTRGLAAEQRRGVDVVLTYGDPAYYSQVGFAQIDAQIAQPPLPLSYPHGWLGQALSEQELRPLAGPSRCLEPFNNPALW